MGKTFTKFLNDFKRGYAREKDPLDIRAERPRFASQPTRSELIRKLRMRNPVRFARLERDMAWLRKQMIELGYDPESAKWLV